MRGGPLQLILVVLIAFGALSWRYLKENKPRFSLFHLLCWTLSIGMTFGVAKLFGYLFDIEPTGPLMQSPSWIWAYFFRSGQYPWIHLPFTFLGMLHFTKIETPNSYVLEISQVLKGWFLGTLGLIGVLFIVAIPLVGLPYFFGVF